MTPIVLAVHFPAKQLSKLRMAAMRLGAKVRVVEKWEYLNAVGALTGDLSSFETFYDGEDFSGQLLVFAHFTDERLQLFLQLQNGPALVFFGQDSLECHGRELALLHGLQKQL